MKKIFFLLLVPVVAFAQPSTPKTSLFTRQALTNETAAGWRTKLGIVSTNNSTFAGVTNIFTTNDSDLTITQQVRSMAISVTNGLGTNTVLYGNTNYFYSTIDTNIPGQDTQTNYWVREPFWTENLVGYENLISPSNRVAITLRDAGPYIYIGNVSYWDAVALSVSLSPVLTNVGKSRIAFNFGNTEYAYRLQTNAWYVGGKDQGGADILNPIYHHDNQGSGWYGATNNTTVEGSNTVVTARRGVAIRQFNDTTIPDADTVHVGSSTNYFLADTNRVVLVGPVNVNNSATIGENLTVSGKLYFGDTTFSFRRTNDDGLLLYVNDATSPLVVFTNYSVADVFTNQGIQLLIGDYKGNGASLTNLSATELRSGHLAAARATTNETSGSAGNVPTSDGAGNLYWATPSGGPGGSATNAITKILTNGTSIGDVTITNLNLLTNNGITLTGTVTNGEAYVTVGLQNIYQIGSSTLTNWSGVATNLVAYLSQLGTAAYSNGLSFQNGSATLTNWSGVATNIVIYHGQAITAPSLTVTGAAPGTLTLSNADNTVLVAELGTNSWINTNLFVSGTIYATNAVVATNAGTDSQVLSKTGNRLKWVDANAGTGAPLNGTNTWTGTNTFNVAVAMLDTLNVSGGIVTSDSTNTGWNQAANTVVVTKLYGSAAYFAGAVDLAAGQSLTASNLVAVETLQAGAVAVNGAMTATNATATFKQINNFTNVISTAPDFAKAYCSTNTAGPITIGLPINVDASKFETTVIVLFGPGTAQQVNPPVGYSSTNGTWFVTNQTVLTISHYGKDATNALAYPLY